MWTSGSLAVTLETHFCRKCLLVDILIVWAEIGKNQTKASNSVFLNWSYCQNPLEKTHFSSHYIWWGQMSKLQNTKFVKYKYFEWWLYSSLLKTWLVPAGWCPVSFFLQCNWLRHRFLATLRECVRRSAEALVYLNVLTNFLKASYL